MANQEIVVILAFLRKDSTIHKDNFSPRLGDDNRMNEKKSKISCGNLLFIDVGEVCQNLDEEKADVNPPSTF
jgi:hypothetical protein